MRTKLKATVLICLGLLLMALPALGACAPQEKPLSNLVIKVEWVEPISLVPKPYEMPKSLASEFNTFHVILSVTNPNDVLVTVESIQTEVFANTISMGYVGTDGPIYLPAGKQAQVRFPITLMTLNMLKEVVMQKHLSVPDAAKMLLGTWKGIEDLEASFQVRGGANVITETTRWYQNFDIHWQP